MKYLLLVPAVVLQAQEWRYYGGDAGGMKYSPLKQINRSNVTDAEAGLDIPHGRDQRRQNAADERVRSDAAGDRRRDVSDHAFCAADRARCRDGQAEVGPSIPSSTSAPSESIYQPRRGILERRAPQADLLWHAGRAAVLDRRRHRQARPGFGNGGHIDLREGVADKFPNRGYGMTSPPAIYKNLVICGALAADGEPQGPERGRARVRRADRQAGVAIPYRAARPANSATRPGRASRGRIAAAPTRGRS